MPMLRIAAFQRRPLFDDVAGTLRRLEADLAWCDEEGVQLALFPECYLQGYASDRPTLERRALSVDGATLSNLLAALAPFQTDLVLGLVEQRGAALYNSAIVIRRRQVLGTYAKCHTNEAGFDAGSAYPVFDSCDWRFGINICNDANHPKAADAVKAQGARLLCYPLNNMLAPATAALWRQKSVDNLRQRAIQTGCWIVSSDVVGAHAGKTSHGCTCIVRPDGSIMAQADEGREAALIADIG